MKTFISIVLLIISIAFSNHSEAIDYAWASGNSIDDKCMVIIWLRGEDNTEDKRLIYESKKENNNCTVYVETGEFERNFKYCVLSGIKVYDGAKGHNASFGGGPAGDRKKYWFEWGDPDFVKPDYYCLLNSGNNNSKLIGRNSFPLQLGDDLSKAEEIIGDLKPWAEQKDVLWNERYGIFIALTSSKKIKRLSISRARGEFDLLSSVYNVLPSDNLKSLINKFGQPIKKKDRTEITDYTFRTEKLFIEVEILSKESNSFSGFKEGDLLWYSFTRAL